MNDKEKKLKMFKSQIRLFTITGIVQTVIIGIFLIFFHEPISVVYFMLAIFFVLWLVAGLKIISAVKAIKMIKKE